MSDPLGKPSKHATHSNAPDVLVDVHGQAHVVHHHHHTGEDEIPVKTHAPGAQKYPDSSDRLNHRWTTTNDVMYGNRSSSPGHRSRSGSPARRGSRGGTPDGSARRGSRGDIAESKDRSSPSSGSKDTSAHKKEAEIAVAHMLEASLAKVHK